MMWSDYGRLYYTSFLFCSHESSSDFHMDRGYLSLLGLDSYSALDEESHALGEPVCRCRVCMILVVGQ